MKSAEKTFDPNCYYVCFDVLTRGDSELSKVVQVDKELFFQLEPYAEELSNGTIRNKECQDAFDEAWEVEDADLRPSEIDEIPEDHYVYIAVC